MLRKLAEEKAKQNTNDVLKLMLDENLSSARKTVNFLVARLIHHMNQHIPVPESLTDMEKFQADTDYVNELFQERRTCEKYRDIPPTLLAFSIPVAVIRFLLCNNTVQFYPETTIMVKGKSVCPWNVFAENYRDVSVGKRSKKT